ncbi:MAG: chaperone protein DnaJ [Fimbriimonadales bacterium]|nr:MAG: chaperone protein DnaJ [Fimbriimonadales bacterium]
MRDYKDYYQILGVSKDADEKEIKAAYRKLARKYHPDVNPGDKTAEEKFKELNEAYQVLSDPEKRAAYDRYGEQWQTYQRMREQYGENFQPGGFEPPFGFGNFQEFIENLLRGGGVGGDLRVQRAPRDLEQTLEINLEDAIRGATRTIQVSVEEPCDACNGTGIASSRRQTCRACGGAGRRRFGMFGIEMFCDECDGTGIVGAPCPICQGRGTVRRTRTLTVNIPAGVAEGQRLRLTGEGAAGANGKRGDLYLRIKFRPDPRFERKEDDLHTEVDIDYLTAILGGEVDAPTPHGVVKMKVPPGTQSGTRFRLAGKGLPLGKGKIGDLYARARITVPKRLSPRERELLEELQRLRHAQEVKA